MTLIVHECYNINNTNLSAALVEIIMHAGSPIQLLHYLRTTIQMYICCEHANLQMSICLVHIYVAKQH